MFLYSKTPVRLPEEETSRSYHPDSFRATMRHGQVGFSSPPAVASSGSSAAKAACASPGTPLSESAFPFEFNPNTTVMHASAQQRCAMKRATEHAAAEHAVTSSPPLAPSAGRSPDASAKPVAAVAEVMPAVLVQSFRQEVAALILQAEALRQRKAKVERLKAGLRLRADHTDRRADAAPSVQPKTSMHDPRKWDELRRVACQLWEADCVLGSHAQRSARGELDASSKATQEAGGRWVSAHEAERALLAKVAAAEAKAAAAEATAAAAEARLQTSEKQRDTALAYLVEQQPLQQKAAQAEAKAEAEVAAAQAKAAEAEQVNPNPDPNPNPSPSPNRVRR